MSYDYTKRGFTIVEVVLVLAIAGLIFLMVFVALPALQRNQRDARRRQDMSLVVSAIEHYKLNNGGTIPQVAGVDSGASCDSSVSASIDPSSGSYDNDACAFIAQYMNSTASNVNEFKDPNGGYYGFVMQKSISKKAVNRGVNQDDTFYYARKSKCSDGTEDDEPYFTFTDDERHYAVYLKLESGSSICRDNSST